MTLGRRASLALVPLVLVAFMLLAASDARAQDTASTANLRPTPDSQVVVLMLRDGSTLIGRVLEVTPTMVRFASAVGESVVPRSAVREVRTRARSDLHDGEIWPEDPSRTRLFFAPTGRMLRQDEVYFSDAYIFFPSIQGGFTDRLSIGAGMSLIPEYGFDTQVYYITPKVGLYASPRLNVAVGALVATAPRVFDEGAFGTVYGVATYGGEDASFTTGAGFGFARNRTSANAVVLIGGSARVSRNVSLLTENYFYTGGGQSALISGGIRFMSEKIAVDLAGFTTTSINGFPVPYVAFLYRF